MKKVMITVLAVAALALAGCKDKPDAQPVSVPRDTTAMREMRPSAAHGEPGQGVPAVNPHANMKPQEMSMGADHKGKVLSAMNASGYTYIEVEEKGERLWVAVMEVEVKPGDEVVFPDSPPVANFHSKTLNRTFDRIILSPGIQINGKPGQMGAHPKTG